MSFSNCSLSLRFSSSACRYRPSSDATFCSRASPRDTDIAAQSTGEIIRSLSWLRVMYASRGYVELDCETEAEREKEIRCVCAYKHTAMRSTFFRIVITSLWFSLSSGVLEILAVVSSPDAQSGLSKGKGSCPKTKDKIRDKSSSVPS